MHVLTICQVFSDPVTFNVYFCKAAINMYTVLLCTLSNSVYGYIAIITYVTGSEKIQHIVKRSLTFLASWAL